MLEIDDCARSCVELNPPCSSIIFDVSDLNIIRFTVFASVCQSFCLSVCLCLSISRMSVFQYVCRDLSLPLSLCTCISDFYDCLSISLSVYSPSLSLSLSLSISLSSSIYISLPAWLAAFLLNHMQQTVLLL